MKDYSKRKFTEIKIYSEMQLFALTLGHSLVNNEQVDWS